MRKELFYVAASRGRESITVVTSDKDILRDTIAHSDIRQSASELAVKACWRCPEHNTPTLRERHFGSSRGREQESGILEKGTQPFKASPICETVSMIEDEATCQPTREQVAEPSHSLDLSR